MGMPPTENLLPFALALLVLAITPGPDIMLVVARGIGQGRRVAVMTVVGIVFVAGLVQIALLVLGVASLLEAHPAALTILRWAGATYLIWLGIRMISARARGNGASPGAGETSAWRAMREGAINSLTNPKSLLFMFAFLPQFVDPAAGPVWQQLLILGALQKFSGIFSLGGVALASGAVGAWLNRRPTFLVWQKRFTGSIMIGLGIRLLLTDNAGPASAGRL
jgi:threonine/homoserine/homoserine lactone efflux protein